MTLTSDRPPSAEDLARPDDTPDIRPWYEHGLVYLVVVAPLVALAIALLGFFGPPITWTTAAIAVPFYMVSGLGITVGYHRYFTHGSFRANRPLRIGLALAGSLAVEGPVIRWVADHRKHHKFSDAEGDPHSPWRYGSSTFGLLRGFYWAHVGWLFDREQTNKPRYAPDLLADKDIHRIHKAFPLLVLASFGLPALLGGLITMSWAGAWSAFFWAGMVRILLLHHVTWSINSVCHIAGSKPFQTTDKAGNVWPLAIISFGESWHNLHHADPTSARHGVDPGQVDLSARAIAIFEGLGWASNVRWPQQARLDKRRVIPAQVRPLPAATTADST